MDDHSSTPEQTEDYSFKDPTRITKWTWGWLYAFLAMTPLGLWMYYKDTAIFVDEPVAGAAWGWVVFCLVHLITAILVCIWTLQGQLQRPRTWCDGTELLARLGCRLALHTDRLVLDAVPGDAGDLAGEREPGRLATATGLRPPRLVVGAVARLQLAPSVFGTRA